MTVRTGRYRARVKAPFGTNTLHREWVRLENGMFAFDWEGET